MKKILIGLCAVLLAGALLWGASVLAAPAPLPNADAETFARANQLYEKGQYAAAVNLYEQLIAQGVENADVYYNLGSASKAMGDAKQAGEAFAHAYMLAPRDADIAQAANASSGMIPAMTPNEVALVALAFTMLLSAVVLMMRQRFVGARVTNQ